MTLVIVTPSFNQDKFIKQTIDSILSQQVEIFYLVRDGGSTDKTVKILKSYRQKIKWVSERDQGQTDAINKGIKYFKKELADDSNDVIFAYLNSDDYYVPQALKKVAKVFKNNPQIKWLVGDAKIVDERGHQIQSAIQLYKKILRFTYSSWLLKIANPLPQPATFIRWSAVQEVGLFNKSLRYVMDYEYWLRLQTKYGNPYFLNQILACFRIHGQSKGGSQFINQFAEQLAVVKKYTTNRFLMALHQWHNQLIITIYNLIKKG